MKPLVRKTTFKKLTQADLASFAQNVYTRMSTKPEYQPFAELVALLGTQLETYKSSLAFAVNRGIDQVAQKEQAKTDLFSTLDRIADQLNVNHTGLETWVLNAGMDVVRDRSVTPIDLDPPYNLRATGRGVRGEAILTFSLMDVGRVVNNGMEYSADNGETWHNGTYSTGTTMKVKGLPSRQSVLFRVCSFGTFQRKSAWSEPVEMFLS